jgi:hypothetical protein
MPNLAVVYRKLRVEIIKICGFSLSSRYHSHYHYTTIIAYKVHLELQQQPTTYLNSFTQLINYLTNCVILHIFVHLTHFPCGKAQISYISWA